jgi:hypothetical protein
MGYWIETADYADKFDLPDEQFEGLCKWVAIQCANRGDKLIPIPQDRSRIRAFVVISCGKDIASMRRERELIEAGNAWWSDLDDDTFWCEWDRKNSICDKIQSLDEFLAKFSHVVPLIRIVHETAISNDDRFDLIAKQPPDELQDWSKNEALINGIVRIARKILKSSHKTKETEEGGKNVFSVIEELEPTEMYHAAKTHTNEPYEVALVEIDPDALKDLEAIMPQTLTKKDIANAVFDGTFRANARFQEPLDETPIEKIHRLRCDDVDWKFIGRTIYEEEHGENIDEAILDTYVDKLRQQHKREYPEYYRASK